jgi:hypothetical protein
MDTWAISVFYQDVVKIYRALEEGTHDAGPDRAV